MPIASAKCDQCGKFLRGYKADIALMRDGRVLCKECANQIYDQILAWR